MDHELRDKIAKIVRDDAPAPASTPSQNASRGGINISGVQGPVHIVQPSNDAAFRRPAHPVLRAIQWIVWRARQWLICLTLGVGISYLALIYLTYKPYLDAGWTVAEILNPLNGVGFSLGDTLLQAGLYGLPAGLAMFLVAAWLTWNDEPPPRGT